MICDVVPPVAIKHYDFELFVPSGKTSIDLTHAVDPHRINDLYQFIIDFYRDNDLDYESYNPMIDTAVKHNNI